MSLKSIFADGFRELKRKSSLHKEKGSLVENEKVFSEKLTLLGRKAWEAKLDIHSHGEVSEALKQTEEKGIGIKSKLADLAKEISGLEEKKKAENAKSEALLKDLEAKKKPVDIKLKSEKDLFAKAWKETESLQNRMKSIPDDLDKIRKKMAESPAEPAAAAENEKRLAALKAEQEQAQQKLPELSKIIQASQEKITPLEVESGRLEGEIKKARDEHKKQTEDIEKATSAAKNAIRESSQKQSEVGRQQDQNYEALGRKLFEAGAADAAVASELAAAQAAKKEAARIQSEIQSLEGQKTGSPRGAVWKMIGLLLLGLVIIAAIAVGIVMLTKHKAGQGAPGKPATQTSQVERGVRSSGRFLES